MDYDVLMSAIRDGVEFGARLASDPDDPQNIRRLRAQFAGQAMQALMTQKGGEDLWESAVADLSVKQADALLIALGYELPKPEEKE